MKLLFSCQVVSDSLAITWTAVCQALLSIGFSRQEYWSGLPFPSPGDLLYLGIECMSPALTNGFFTHCAPREAQGWVFVFLPCFGRLQLKKESDQDTVHVPIYACNLGKEFNFVNLAYRDRLIFFWEGWECFAITGEDTWQLSHESWNGFCRVVSKFTLSH